MRSLSFLGWALLAACSPKNVYTDDLDTADSLVDSQDTGEVPVPSFEGIWKGNELRFLTRNGGFDENGNPIPEGQDYQALLSADKFCISQWYLTVQSNLKVTWRVSYINSSECTGGVDKADYVEESQWIVNASDESVYVHPTSVESETGELPEPYYLSYRWNPTETGFDLGVTDKDFDGDGAEDDSQFVVYWRDLDG